MTSRSATGPFALGFLLLAACPGTPPPGNDGGTPDGGATWFKDVQPIVQARCQRCHSEGGVGPFPLMTPEDVKNNAGSIYGVVSSGYMPPWLPAEACHPTPLRDVRRLSQAEVKTIEAWEAAGMPAGDPSDAPPAPDAGALATVSATLDPGASYTPVPEIDTRCFALSPAVTAPQDLVAFEIVPGVRKIVRSAMLYELPASVASALDAAEAGPGWSCGGVPLAPDGGIPRPLGSFSAAHAATRLPDTTGLRLTPGNVVVLQVRYDSTAATAKPDRTTVKVQYAASPVAVPLEAIPVANTGFVVPPMSTEADAGANYPASGVTPAAMRLWAVQPQLREQGKSARLALANGQCLLDLIRWDTSWQQTYFYSAPVALPAGSSVRLDCHWFNNDASPLKWGTGADGELCLGYLYVSTP